MSKKVFLMGCGLSFISFCLAVYLLQSKQDIAIHQFMANCAPFLHIQDVWGFLSWLGEDHIQILICVFMGIFYYKRQNYSLSRVWYSSTIIFLLSGLCVQILKHIIARPRPKMLPEYDFTWLSFGAEWHSMPSGHTMTTFAWLACILPFYSLKVRLFLVVAASLIGFSRVGIGAHYLSDVLVGAVLGYVFGMVLREKFKLRKEIK